MAGPVLAIPGIAWLWGGLVSIIGGIISWLGSYLAKRLTVRIALVAASLALTATFASAMGALFNGISLIAPQWLTAATGHFMPSNVTACFSACVAASVARYIYVWRWKYLVMKNK